jgi:hypothetical protein
VYRTFLSDRCQVSWFRPVTSGENRHAWRCIPPSRSTDDFIQTAVVSSIISDVSEKVSASIIRAEEYVLIEYVNFCTTFNDYDITRIGHL